MASRKKPQLPKRLFNHMKLPKLPPGSQIIAPPAGTIKMSKVLEDFVGPYLGSDFDGEKYQGMYRLAVLAWNASLLQPENQQAFLKKLGQLDSPGTDPWDALLMVEMVSEMIRRKQEVYPHVRRYIVSFELTETDRKYHLVVKSRLFNLPA